MVDENGITLRSLPFVAADWYCAGCAAIAKHDKARGDDPPSPGIATALVPVAWAASLADDD